MQLELLNGYLFTLMATQQQQQQQQQNSLKCVYINMHSCNTISTYV